MREFEMFGRRVVDYSILDAACRLADLVSEGESVVYDDWEEEDRYWAELEAEED